MRASTLADGDRAGLPSLRTRRVRRHGGTPGVVQMIVVEVVGVTVGLALLAGNMIAVAVAGIIGACVLAAVFGRIDGRWLYDEALARWRIGRRRAQQDRARRQAAGPPHGPGMTVGPGTGASSALATLAPGLAVTGVTDRSRTIGVGRDEDGWFAALSIGSFADVSGSRSLRVDLEQLVRMMDESSVPISSLQLASHCALAPAAIGAGAGPANDAASPALRSYRELAGPTGCPLEQTLWLALRLTPADAAEAAQSRGGGVDGVHRGIAAAVGRIEKALSTSGVPHRSLDADALGEAVERSCAPLMPGGTQPGLAPREKWGSWQSDGLAHVTFTVTRWPQDARQDLMDALSRIPAVAVSYSLSVRLQGERVLFLGLVRVVAPVDGFRVAARQLTKTAARLGVGLRRLDGEQAPAVYATAPTGGAV
jgi:type VII secretion protein EccE